MSEQKVTQDINIKLVDGAVSVIKTGFPNPVMLGLELNYDIVVINNTSSPAESIDVVIEDQLNSNFSFVKAQVIGGAAVTPSYVNGLLTCDIGTIGIGESKTLTVTVIPKVAGIIANQAKAKVTAVSGDMDYLSTIVDITIVDVVTQLGNVKTTVDSTATEVGSIKTTVDSTATQVGSIKTTVDSTATEVGSIKTTVDSTENKVDNLTTIDTETNGIVKLIQQEIGGIVNPGVYNLTTGVVIKDYNAASIIAAIDRKIGSTSIVQVTVSLIDHTQNEPQVIYSKTVDVTKHNNIFVLGAPPAEYEVLFECVEEGVYVWTAARTNGVFDSVSVNNLISSNTFKQSDLIMIEPQA